MSIGRKKALERLAGLVVRVEEHLDKIAASPQDPAVAHWKHEVAEWLGQMEEMARHVGRKTGAEWTARIDALRRQLEG